MNIFKKNNFINVRIQTSNHTKELNDIKHNLRKNPSQADYRKDQDNIHYIYDDEIKKYKQYKDENAYKNFETKVKELREKHNQIFLKNNKRQLRERNSTFLNAVITFSEEQKNNLNNGNFKVKEFRDAALTTFKEMAKEMKTELLYFSIHLKETTPHFQAHFKNFDEDGKSIFYKNRTKDKLSKLQDIGFKHFEKLGIKRGIKKDITNNTNKPLKSYYEQTRAAESKKYIKTIQQQIKQTKELRNEIKDLDIELDDKKKIYSNISSIQKELRETKKKLSVSNSANELNNINIARIKTENKELIGKINHLKSEIVSLNIYKTYKDDNDNLEKENKELKQDLLKTTKALKQANNELEKTNKIKEIDELLARLDEKEQQRKKDIYKSNNNSSYRNR